mgnify:CR=1 FL=1
MWVDKTNGFFDKGTYTFREDGTMVIVVLNGIVDGYYYVDNVKTYAGLLYIGGDYYYAGEGGKIITDQSAAIDKMNGLLPAGTYRFDETGKMIRTTEIVNEDGTLYYYENGMRTADAGVIELDDNLYYVGAGAVVPANATTAITKTNGLVEAGTYRSDADGKLIMTTEIVNEDGALYYYKDGKRTADAGLVEFDGNYYYIDGSAQAVTDTTMYVERTNGFFPAGEYTFREDGTMVIPEREPLNGIVEGYYYVDDVKTAAGLLFISGDYYYAAEGGKIVTSQSYEIVQTNDLLEAGIYCFDAEGKIIMKSGLYEENGGLYYYENGRLMTGYGLVEVDGDYYYIDEILWIHSDYLKTTHWQ